MKCTDVVVLNDMHPIEFPGAASIAFDHALYASKTLSVEFWHASNFVQKPFRNSTLLVRSFNRNSKMDQIVNRFMFARILNELFPSVILIKILIKLLIVRPKVVWVNQIGLRIPRTIVVFLFLLRIKTIQTFHDFSLISPRKLYPENLKGAHQLLLSKNRIVNVLYLVRSKYLFQITKLNVTNVCISSMQLEIYLKFGLNKAIQIPNGIPKCDCELGNSFEKIPNTVLFAGRTLGKGFEKICRIIKSNPSWKLLAAGSPDLFTKGLSYLDDLQFEYLGFLGQRELFRRIHNSDFVALLSECFDVYPTIGLEAFMHDSVPISSNSTGIAQLINETSCGVVIDDINEVINLSILKTKIAEQPKFPTNHIELQMSGERYLKILETAIFNTH